MTIPPLAILALGIAIVLGMILVLRINAFLALLTAAIVVSLLAPGATADKISRVAVAFGEAAASVGIVIALAAVIGQCMMDSGAADRVVRSFLKLLGEKRAPIALLGSGYILAVPVFFDTVFYLLVPLARSFYKRTGGQYLRCLLAIAAGGAVTHTLVPPTPGPLTIAANLNIDLGMMIGIGALVALPSAIAGLVFAGIMDRVMPIPMRPLSDREEPEPLPDAALPSLPLSLLPVLLPVLLIGASTALGTLADAEGAALLRPGDVNWSKLRELFDSPIPPLRQGTNSIVNGVPYRLRTEWPDSPEARDAALKSLNEGIRDRDAIDMTEGLRMLRLRESVAPSEPGSEQFQRLQALRELIETPTSKLSPALIQRRNRLYMEVAMPEVIRPHVWNTPLRQASHWAALFGNPNFALLLSTAIAIGLYLRTRRPPKAEMERQIETALMSGGVIILITAAGVAFGKMLQAAQVGPAIEALFSTEGEPASGLVWLLIGFGVASVLKVAQGSSTAAMIIGSSMLAPTATSGVMPFHAVYLATAIASGSLVGSWMNDSGFWVFTKLSGLTEAEGLKSWTPLLVVLGVTGFLMSLLLAIVMPMTS